MQAQPDTQTLSNILSGQLDRLDWDSPPDGYWHALVRLAQVEGVAPLVHWSLSKSGKTALLPASARNALRISYASTWIRNQGNLKDLINLQHLMDQEKIPMVLLKGICFILTIYPDIGLRPMGDMDVLVPRQKWEKAVAAAKTLGFDNDAPGAAPGLQDLLGHDIHLEKKGTVPAALELHHSVVADKTFTYSVPTDWFWDQTEPLDTKTPGIGPGSLLMLSPVAQILYAASHAMLQHGGAEVSLCWYYDMDRLIHHYRDRLDWEQLLRQARSFEWGSALNAALAKTHAYFHTPIPGIVLDELSGITDRNSQLVALKQKRPATHVLQEHQKLLSLNWHGRLRLLQALVVPSPAYMRWRYGLKSSWKLIIHYPLRWWGILMDAAKTVMELLKKKPSTRI